MVKNCRMLSTFDQSADPKHHTQRQLDCLIEDGKLIRKLLRHETLQRQVGATILCLVWKSNNRAKFRDQRLNRYQTEVPTVAKIIHRVISYYVRYMSAVPDP